LGLLVAPAKRKDVSVIPNDHDYADLLANKHGAVQLPVIPETDIALAVIYHGTTGTPKGAMLSHLRISAARQINCIDPESVPVKLTNR
jgi:acyl-CoA synthetase (AMP-forming)/AMP-acid ligase II